MNPTDFDTIEQKIAHYRALMKGYRERRRVLERQIAYLGINASVDVVVELKDINSKLENCELIISHSKQNAISERLELIKKYNAEISELNKITKIDLNDTSRIIMLTSQSLLNDMHESINREKPTVKTGIIGRIFRGKGKDDFTPLLSDDIYLLKLMEDVSLIEEEIEEISLL
jgi:hypothetical protein